MATGGAFGASELAAIPGERIRGGRPLDSAPDDCAPASHHTELMCGICGVIARDHAQLDSVAEAQVATMHHRGPDSHGTFRAPYGAISQNRLSIIDLVTGDPPITNEDGT